MKFNELYVLNSAIDGEDIYSISTFASRRLSKVQSELVKDVLIQKGYLEDYDTITTMGANEIGKIKYFKEAKKYIHLLNLTIGWIDEEIGILLKKNQEGEYIFSVINMKESVQVLEELFPHVLEDQEDENTHCKNDRQMSPRELLDQYAMSAKTSFTLQTKYLVKQEKNTKELFFELQGKRYYYDCKSSLLHERNGDELKKILRERMEVF